MKMTLGPNIRRILYVGLLIIFFGGLLLWVPQIRNTRFMLTVVPPKDLYDDLVRSEIRLDGSVKAYDFVYAQKYVGTYLYGIRFSKMPVVGIPLQPLADLTVSATAKGAPVIFKRKVKWVDRFGATDVNSGILFGSFSVPADMPINEYANIHLTINSIDPSTAYMYGNATFFVSRAADF